jgi:hypothetical protein
VADRFEKLGALKVQSLVQRDIGADGGGHAVCALAFPQMIVPRYYTCSMRIISPDSVGTTQPEAQMAYATIGALMPMFRGQTTQEDGADVTLDEILGRYMSDAQNDWYPDFDTEDDALETDVGLPGDQSLESPQMREQKFLKRKGILGLPGKAMFKADSDILYVDQFFKRGRLPRVSELMDPHLVGIGFWADDISFNTDSSTYIFANAGDADMRALYENVITHMGSFQGENEAVQEAVPTSLVQFIDRTFSDVTGVNTGATLNVTCRVTVTCDVYINTVNRRWIAPA